MTESPEIAALAKQARDGLDRLERLADDADHLQCWTVTTDYDGPKIHVNDTLDDIWVRDGAGVSGAYTCDDPYDDCREARARYESEAQLIVERCDPERLRADVAARRTLLDEALAWRHGLVRWDHDRVLACDSVLGKPCDCGRGTRVRAVLTALAAPYQEAS